MSRARGVVVLGGYVNALGVVRSLAARGLPVAVVRTKPFDLAHRSRHCVGQATALGIEERPELLVEVLEREQRWHGWALMPTNDESLAATLAYFDRLEPLFIPIVPNPDA